MPYWVEQRLGSHKEACNKIVKEYREGQIDGETARSQFCKLYCKANGITEMPEWWRNSHGPDRPVSNYEITLWFPLYANMWWSDGTASEGERSRVALERKHGGKFELCWEY